MSTPPHPLLPNTPPHRSLLTAFADAIGVVLVLDAVLTALTGWTAIGPVFFHLPTLPAPALWPAVFGAGILARCRPAIAVAILVAGWNALGYAAAVEAGAIIGLPVCLSLGVAFALAPALRYRRLAHPAAIAAVIAPLLLGHLFTFGCTDYRRGAEAIVVFGAKAYSPTCPSEVLADRTLTAIDLYKQGYAPALVFSGGGCEPEAMRHLALQAGVPPEDIVLDGRGLNTEATLRNLQGRFGRVLAVSNYYHNARIKLTAQRLGLTCYTVPARMRRHLRQEPYYVARECAAYAKYYLTVR